MLKVQCLWTVASAVEQAVAKSSLSQQYVEQSLTERDVQPDMPEPTRIQTWQGNFLAIAALSLIAHNLYLGVLIFQQPDRTFRKAFALGSKVSAWDNMII
ncbi:hypothetical protein WJX77_009276 [Trebouxia sp. C0004]